MLESEEAGAESGVTVERCSDEMNRNKHQKETRNKKGRPDNKAASVVDSQPVQDTAQADGDSGKACQEGQHAEKWTMRQFFSRLTPGERAAFMLTSITTVIGAILGGLTIYVMNRQTTIMGQQTQIMQDDRDANQAIQRANMQWVSVTSAHGPNIKGANYAFSTYAVWENTGATDAVDVMSHVYLDQIPGGPSLAQFIGTSRKVDMVPSVVRRGGTLNSEAYVRPESFFFGKDLSRQGMPIPLVAENLLSRNIFMFGWVAYRDRFPNSKPHVTGICKKLRQIHTRINPPREMAQTWGTCPESPRLNCVDQDCEGYDEIVKLLP